jgi:hypothetical protein
MPLRLRRLAPGLAAALLLTSLAACGSGKQSVTAGPPPAASTADERGSWTVFAYVDGDNNLEPFALSDLAEMSKATGTDIVALLDRSPEYSDEDLGSFGDFSDTRLLHLRDGNVEAVGSPGELNMGDPATLTSFLAEGLARYHSDHYGLVIWDHGGAWTGAAVDESSGNDLLELGEIASGVRDGLARSGKDRLDFVGFDACLMATYETAHALQPYARYLLASEEVEPGHGWDWSAVSVPEGGATTAELAGSIIKGFGVQADESGEGEAITLSLLDLDRLGGVDGALADLSGLVGKGAAGLIGRVGAGRERALGFGRSPDPAADYHMVDVGDLGRELSGVDGLADAAGRLQRAVDDLVVDQLTAPATAAATGVSVYFPPTKALGNSKYGKITVPKPWADFLRTYYTAAENVPEADLPSFLDTDRYLEDNQVRRGDAGVELRADVSKGTGVNVASARLYWGQVDMDDTSQVLFYGERNAAINGDTVSASYDWRMLTISDGRSTAAAYASLDVDDEGEIRRIIVPGTLKHAGNNLDAYLALGVSGGSVTSQRFYGATGSATAEVSPGPGDTFTPRLLLQDLDTFESTWVDAPTGALEADPDVLTYRYQRVAGATPVMVELGITDVAGNADFVFHGTATPA